MTTIGQRERETQDRVIELFQEKMGYTYLGNWENRENNSNIEKEHLTKFLKKKYSTTLIKKAINEIEKAASNQNKTLYEINKEVYGMLRYGVNVREKTGENKKTVWLIDWKNPIFFIPLIIMISLIFISGFLNKRYKIKF